MTDTAVAENVLRATLEVGVGEKAGRFSFEIPYGAFEDPVQVANLVATAGPGRPDYEHASVTLVLPDDPWSLALFAVVVGAGHGPVNVRLGDQTLPIPALINSARKAASTLPDPGAGYERPDALTVAVHPTEPLASRLSSEELFNLKSARHLVLDRALASLPRIFEDLAFVSGLRAQSHAPFRLPWVKIGLADDSHLKLGEFRSAGFQATKDTWSLDAPAELVEAGDPLPYVRGVEAARKADVRAVLRIMNSVSVETEEGERWRCVRPQNHTNGDKNPSMVIEGNKVRCFRCDPEPRDPVSLVMSVGAMTPAEAALAILEAVQEAPAA